MRLKRNERAQFVFLQTEDTCAVSLHFIEFVKLILELTILRIELKDRVGRSPIGYFVVSEVMNKHK